nr:hypothetical protein [Mycobacterium riyadhense]
MQQLRTRMFARVLGPFLVIATLTAMARTSDMPALLSNIETNPLLTWVTGAFVLLGGLIVIALHQCWRGTAAITVSLLGWAFAVRGLLLLSFPQAFMSIATAAMDMTLLWVTLEIFAAVVGLYLTYIGWGAMPRQAVPQADAATLDLPRAA